MAEAGPNEENKCVSSSSSSSTRDVQEKGLPRIFCKLLCLLTDIFIGDGLECAVCLQTCIHPAQLPCGHIFCFLCVKGIANQSKKCAMCRQEIPRDFIEHPNLLQLPTTTDEAEGFDGGYQWFYEGRNGKISFYSCYISELLHSRLVAV